MTMNVQQVEPREGPLAPRYSHQEEIVRVVSAVARGELDTRANPRGMDQEHAVLLMQFNSMADSLIRPLRLASGAIENIARGAIPDFVIDDFEGEFDVIKRNINAFLAVMYGMHREMGRLTESVSDGALAARGNDWDFKGNWQSLIGGVNDTLDAVVGPVDDARSVLQRIAEYDLTARMTAEYRGDHAQIKRAVNATADALSGALRRVAEVAMSMSQEAAKLKRGSELVERGAAEQERATEDASQMLEILAESCQANAQAAAEVEASIKASTKSVDDAAAATQSLTAAMADGKAASEATLAVLKEIDALALKTDGLALSAAKQGAAVAASGRGFAVVADEVRALSGKCGQAAVAIERTIRQGSTAERARQTAALAAIATEFREVARSSAFLAVNAAVEAAHVDEAGRGFEAMTAQVRGLSKESKEAAVRSGDLIHRCIDAAAAGELLAKQIHSQLNEVVPQVQRVTTLAGRITTENQSLADGVADVAASVRRIYQITTANARSAADTSTVAASLAAMTETLDTLVRRFRLPN